MNQEQERKRIYKEREQDHGGAFLFFFHHFFFPQGLEGIRFFSEAFRMEIVF